MQRKGQHHDESHSGTACTGACLCVILLLLGSRDSQAGVDDVSWTRVLGLLRSVSVAIHHLFFKQHVLFLCVLTIAMDFRVKYDLHVWPWRSPDCPHH